MFKDYFKILGVPENVAHDELKAAFKKKAIEWHPDKNPGKDTTIQMQEINEAYLILKDNEARERYYLEYLKYKEFQKQKTEFETSNYDYKEQSTRNKEKYYTHNQRRYYKYEVQDEILAKWIRNAILQSIKLAEQTIIDFKNIAKEGAKGAAKEAGYQFIYQILGVILLTIIIGIVKSCH